MQTYFQPNTRSNFIDLIARFFKQCSCKQQEKSDRAIYPDSLSSYPNRLISHQVSSKRIDRAPSVIRRNNDQAIQMKLKYGHPKLLMTSRLRWAACLLFTNIFRPVPTGAIMLSGGIRSIAFYIISPIILECIVSAYCNASHIATKPLEVEAGNFQVMSLQLGKAIKEKDQWI